MTPGPGHLAPVTVAARIDANGTMWRLRSLVAMGHDCARIARALGVTPGLVRWVVRGQARTITRELQATACQLWDSTCDTAVSSGELTCREIVVGWARNLTRFSHVYKTRSDLVATFRSLSLLRSCLARARRLVDRRAGGEQQRVFLARLAAVSRAE